MQKSKPKLKTKKLVKTALSEDVGAGDFTTNSIVPKVARAKAIIVAKENGTIAGLSVAKQVFCSVDKKIKFSAKVKDGAKVKKGKVIATLSGPARGILTGERSALNFLQRLSGIATLTSRFVDLAHGTSHLPAGRHGLAQILDTRKTIPGLRILEKQAVKAGGGANHRFGLYDAILIKDNHIAIAGGIKSAIKLAKKKNPKKFVEVEAKKLTQVKQAIEIGVDRILLDNMNLKTLRQAVKLCRKAKIKTEASGGVNLKTIKQVAKTGVDCISVGALTHSAQALDISLLVD